MFYLVIKILLTQQQPRILLVTPINSLISCTWRWVVPIGEDPAAHGHWCTFIDLYHAIVTLPTTQQNEGDYTREMPRETTMHATLIKRGASAVAARTQRHQGSGLCSWFDNDRPASCSPFQLNKSTANVPLFYFLILCQLHFRSCTTAKELERLA